MTKTLGLFPVLSLDLSYDTLVSFLPNQDGPLVPSNAFSSLVNSFRNSALNLKRSVYLNSLQYYLDPLLCKYFLISSITTAHYPLLQRSQPTLLDFFSEVTVISQTENFRFFYRYHSVTSKNSSPLYTI